MFNRFMFLLHWAILIGISLFTIAVLQYVWEQGIERAATDESVWGVYGATAVFFVIDYIIYGKITWFPWERDK